jgi:hypothetical protein
VLYYYYRKTGEIWYNPVGCFKPYDGINQSKTHSVEIKFEALAAETYNLCIEYQYKGEPSGIASTTAEKWVHVVPVDRCRMCCYEFDTDTLRDRLGNHPLLSGGDRNWSKFRLLPLQKAEEIKTNKFILTINWDGFKPYWAEKDEDTD